MNKSGRLALQKCTLSAMTIYTSICICFPPWMHKALDKIMKVFLWVGSDEIQGGKCLLAWQKVQ
jgi:hypothetical protein